MSCENSDPSITKICQINCNIGCTSEDGFRKQDSLAPRSDCGSGAKPKRKSRAARRRLHAMMSNVSLHFSDTDSEDELSVIKTKARHQSPSPRSLNGEMSPPVIEVTLETAETEPVDSHWDGMRGGTPNSDRRSSFGDVLTDVDELDFEQEDGKTDGKGLIVPDNNGQGETDVEDMSNDEGEADDPIIITGPGVDILREFGGGTITTKEGDGPFSVEVRNQMSFDDGDELFERKFEMRKIPQGPDTDSDDVEISDEEPEPEGACGHNLMDFDLLAASQIFMKNTNKMENSLLVPDQYEDGISDSHTDIEDID